MADEETPDEPVEPEVPEGYEGNPPPGEWEQDPEAEIQLEGVRVREDPE